MYNKTSCLLVGLMLGILIGYQKESEIDDIARQVRKTKKKMIRKMDDVKEHFEM